MLLAAHTKLPTLGPHRRAAVQEIDVRRVDGDEAAEADLVADTRSIGSEEVVRRRSLERTRARCILRGFDGHWHL